MVANLSPKRANLSKNSAQRLFQDTLSPIRAAYKSETELSELGSLIARGEPVELPQFSTFNFGRRLTENSRLILHTFRAADAAARNNEVVTPAGQWLLDNHYTIDKTVQQARRDFPRSFLRQLPVFTHMDNMPRIFALAWLYVAHTDSSFTQQGLTALIEGFQQEKILHIGELWALPSAVRMLLVENARRIALRVEKARQMRHLANLVADKIALAKSETERNALFNIYQNRVADDTFSTHLLYRLRGTSMDVTSSLIWLEQKLHANGSNPDLAASHEHNRQTADGLTMGNIIRSLKAIDDCDWTTWFENVSRVDFLLRTSGDFSAIDFHSRNAYRVVIEKIARRSPLTEIEVTEKALQLAQNKELGDNKSSVSWYFMGGGRTELEKACSYKPSLTTRFMRYYRAMKIWGIALPVTLLTLMLIVAVYVLLRYCGMSPLLSLFFSGLALLPTMDTSFSLFNTIFSWCVTPTRLVGYEYRSGIPADARTLVVVPTLITSRDSVDEQIRNLEIHYLSNPQGAVGFALVTDWADADEEETADDLDLYHYAQRSVQTLNDTYCVTGERRFFLLHRRRFFNESEEKWMGWERKRGKLHELNLLLRKDRDTSFFPPDPQLPMDVRFIMTLDADTKLTPGAVTKLVGKLNHPLNRPVIDANTQLVTEGYAILQPRVTPSLTVGDEASFLQRVFSVNRGIDPYVFAVSDTYQDLLGEGTFTGKGLYDIDAFEAALNGRIAENAVLSHDLLEGGYARCALVSDVEIVEDYPTAYHVDVARHHRWIRGDWQLLPYLLTKKNISLVTRWKMQDNLRRSLTPLFWILASFFGWSCLPFAVALWWQIFLLLGMFAAPTLGVLRDLLPTTLDNSILGHVQSIMISIWSSTADVMLRITFLAHSAYYSLDAIFRTLYRLTVSRKHLLEWKTSAASKSAPDTITHYLKTMWPASAIGVVSFIVPLMLHAPAAPIAFPFALLWILSPIIGWRVSRSAAPKDALNASVADKSALRRIARRTWLYYETFVNSDNNFLPPDNVQEVPETIVAQRTSPTNIGVYLLSIVAARDFGWISFNETLERIDNTLNTLDRLEKFRGHLYNWYETNSLRPLVPSYVSTVDSGNLAGHLVTLASTLNEWSEAPSVYIEADLEGLNDVNDILEETLRSIADDRRILRPLRRRIFDQIENFRAAVHSVVNTPQTVAFRSINFPLAAHDLLRLTQEFDEEVKSAASSNAVAWAKRLIATCKAHYSDAQDEIDTQQLRQFLSTLAERARTLAFEMQFDFLERPERRLLSIGYRVQENELDASCYDLLASEARLSSLFAIAKGDIAVEHWFRLGRLLVPVGWKGALLSWSGSMFEYLMPPLVMSEPLGSLLDQTNRLVVRRQIQYAKQRGLPWGISEAAFNARDQQLNYQYSNFGVPSLGLQRGLSRNAVIAPYASLLAAQYKPREAIANLKRLEKLGALGTYGFYDAVDFTPSRLPDGAKCAVVKNYYAHHHGMSILAVDNVVFEGRMRQRFHRDPVIEAAELLLQEKAPREIPLLHAKTTNPMRSDAGGFEDAPLRIINDPLMKAKSTLIMANGDYSVMLTAAGSGYSRWQNIDITRFRHDATEDQQGTFIFLRDTVSGRWWSATGEPTRVPEEEALTVFSDEKAEFQKTVDGIKSTLEIIMAGEGHGEGRRIELVNSTNKDRIIEVTSYAELVLNEASAAAAHPVFSNMFVETEIDDNGATIFARRRKRSPQDADIHFVHFVTDAAGTIREAEAETDRRVFIGRGRSIRRPAAFDRDSKFNGNQGAVLDPIAAIRCRIRVPAHKKAQLIFWTFAASSREALEQNINYYRQSEAFQREYSAAWMRSQVLLYQLAIKPADALVFQQFATSLLYPEKTWRLPAEAIADNLGQQSDLWPLAISGDFPIFLLRLDSDIDMRVLQSLLSAQEYWRHRGLIADVVILNERAFSYAQDTQRSIEWLSESYRNRAAEGINGQHLFTIRRDQISENSFKTLLASARIVLHAQNGSLAEQLKNWENIDQEHANTGADKEHNHSIKKSKDKSEELQPLARRATAIGLIGNQLAKTEEIFHSDLQFWNGYGGFAEDGSYIIRVNGQLATPQPWINVLCNKQFGTLVSAEGSAFTWFGNSRDYQLTAWSNDAVANRTSEALYIVDRESLYRFSPTACVERDVEATYETQHAMGFSRFSASHDGIESELTHVIDKQEAVRYSCLRLKNVSRERRRLRVYNFLEWVLGNNRVKTAPFIIPNYDHNHGIAYIRNPYQIAQGRCVAFVTASQKPSSVTGDRTEFIGTSGTIKHPSAIRAAKLLSNTFEAGRDVSTAFSYDIDLNADEEKQIIFIVGCAEDQTSAETLAKKATKQQFAAVLADQKAHWQSFTSAFQVKTPDPSFDLMVNYWLPYQAYAGRMLARTGFYQASGAYGFRDQLQDSLALILLKPELARHQLLLAASRQFKEGDVQHWWLPETGAGIRSMISDDIVWLVYGTAHYINTTGDHAILNEEVAFLAGDLLKEGEQDRYFLPELSPDKATLYEHCALALDLAIKRIGEHDLPLILGGDWNDGMNLVGRQGKGESIWLGWFLGRAILDFLPFAIKRNDSERIIAWQKHCDSLTCALESSGWDGAWYRRGYYDDATPLGSAESDECRIDTIAQSWAVLSGLASKERQKQAMASMLDQLWDKEYGLLRLFWPPFNNSSHDPGYIKGYPRGVRENGGQYTHGALWSVLALSELGDHELAYELLAAINPVNHGKRPDLYRVEPYVVAADIYSVHPMRGRGGWTWYTGSAGWFYRAATEAILGIRRRGDRLIIKPQITADWPGYQASLRFGQANYNITVKRGKKLAVTLNNIPVDIDEGFILRDEGEHEILIII